MNKVICDARSGIMIVIMILSGLMSATILATLYLASAEDKAGRLPEMVVMTGIAILFLGYCIYLFGQCLLYRIEISEKELVYRNWMGKSRVYNLDMLMDVHVPMGRGEVLKLTFTKGHVKVAPAYRGYAQLEKYLREHHMICACAAGKRTGVIKRMTWDLVKPEMIKCEIQVEKPIDYSNIIVMWCPLTKVKEMGLAEGIKIYFEFTNHRKVKLNTCRIIKE